MQGNRIVRRAVRGAIMLAAAGAGVGGLALTAQAQGARMMEEIVVTATKREQSVQDIPFTVQAIGAQELIDSGAFDLSGIVDRLAGVEFRTSQAGQGGIAIRGIQELNTANIYGGTGAAVGLYVDEAPFTVAGLMPQTALFDLERLEVLKGPQGSLFGEGSLGGTVRLVTNKPNPDAFGFSADHTFASVASGGQNNITNAMVNIPLVEGRLALRAVGFFMDEDGWIDRVVPDVGVQLAAPPNPILGPGAPNVITTFAPGGIEKDVNGARSKGGRVQLQWEPGDDFRANLSAMLLDADRGARNRGTLDRQKVLTIDNDSAEDKLVQTALVLEKDFSAGTVVSASSYLDRDIDYAQDQLGILNVANLFAVPLSFAVGQPVVIDALGADYRVVTRDFSQELRFVSDLDGRLQFTAGLFYKDRDFKFNFTTPTDPPIPAAVWNAAVGGPLFTQPGEGDIRIASSSNTRQVAAFGELSFELTDRLDLLAGGRLFRERRKSESTAFGVFIGVVPPRQFEADARETVFSPRLSLSYALADNMNTYLTYSEGFRSGGQNNLNPLVPQADVDVYDSEQIRTYELGAKSDWLNGDLVLNTALFFNDWRDLQVVLAQGPGGAGEVIGNAGKARSYGVDVDLAWSPVDSLVLNAAATLMNASIRDSILTVPNADGTQRIPVPVGTDIPLVAERQLSLAGTYRAPINATLTGFGRASIAYVSDSLTRLDAISGTQNVPPRQSGYTRVDLRVGVETEHWTVAVFANNLFDRDIILNTLGPDPISNAMAYQLGAPRTVGINVRFNY